MANPVSISKLMIPFVGTGSFIPSPHQLKQRDGPWLFPLSLILSSFYAVVEAFLYI
jgi:hypothetical protein